MQILITGAAGFIGFNLSKYLLDKSNVKIIGVDSLNTYYSKKLSGQVFMSENGDQTYECVCKLVAQVNPNKVEVY